MQARPGAMRRSSGGTLRVLDRDGRQPDSPVTLGRLLGQYTRTAGWDLFTRDSSLGYIIGLDIGG